MNPNYMEHKFPQIKPHPFNKVFRKADANAIDLIARLLEYTPTERLAAVDAMVHPFFDELRDPSTRFPDSRHGTGQLKDMPALFDFSRHGKAHARFVVFVHACMLTTSCSRAVDRSASQPPTCAAPHGPGARVAGTRYRQLHAHGEAGDDGETGLSWPVLTNSVLSNTRSAVSVILGSLCCTSPAKYHPAIQPEAATLPSLAPL